ncbi:GntR family transcriptional regulator [Streptomyces griseus]|uniref:GntR family transcriptional regulator n=1 Tax=Streptomyces griseus TaxID=1911 RepID=UPI0036C9691E
MPTPPERTALYRLYGTDDRLLYIGITDNPKARWERHAAFKWWWAQVTRKQVDWLNASWREALDIEKAAIREERPAYNGTHNHGVAPFDAAAWPRIEAQPRQKFSALADLIRAEIASGRWQAGDRLPDAEDLATASGVGEGTAQRAFRELVNEGSIMRLHGLGTFVRARIVTIAPNRILRAT